MKGHRSGQLASGSLKAQTAANDADWREAVHWYRSAADAGHPGAMMSLARLYEGAYGVPADRDAALALYQRALAAAEAGAAGEIERLGEGAGRTEYAGGGVAPETTPTTKTSIRTVMDAG